MPGHVSIEVENSVCRKVFNFPSFHRCSQYVWHPLLNIHSLTTDMDTGGGKDFSTTRFIIYIFCEKHLITTWFAMVILHFLCRLRHISCRLGPKWGQREGQVGWNCCKTEFEPCLDCPLCGYLWFTDPFHHCQLFLRNWPIFGSLLYVYCIHHLLIIIYLTIITIHLQNILISGYMTKFITFFKILL